MADQDRSKRTTLADVAARVGVSAMTVSRVMNRDARVSGETRQKVEAAIADLNYAPNIAARSLAVGQVTRICLLYDNPSSAYLGELLLGALEAAAVEGAHLIVERTGTNFKPSGLARRFGQDWDALIIPPPISDDAGLRDLVSKHGFPAVFLSSAAPATHTDEIRIDDYAAARELTMLLISKEHRRIGFIKGNPNQTVSAERFAGYRDALSDAGLAFDPHLIADGLFTYRSGEYAATQLLATEHRPTAIFASNDDMAAGTLAAAARLGISVPRELAVAGFDDLPIASTVWPTLTTSQQPVARMSALAVQRLIEVGRGDLKPKIQVLPHRIVERGST